MENLNNISQTFKSLSHKRRVLLFNLLLDNRQKNLSFGDLQKMSRILVAPLTHHLAFLEKGGLIHRQVKGAHTYFSLQLHSFRSVLQVVQSHCGQK
jgi:DNA-binding HxlR family transcriptional regulator